MHGFFLPLRDICAFCNLIQLVRFSTLVRLLRLVFQKLIELSEVMGLNLIQRERLIFRKHLVTDRGLEWKLRCLPKRRNEADVSRFART